MSEQATSDGPPRREKDASGTLRLKLLVGCMVPLVAAVACQALYTVRAQRAAMLGGLQGKADSLGKLMVDVVGPSVALDDPEGAAQALGYVQKDADFALSAVIGVDGKVTGFRGADAARAALSRLAPVGTDARIIEDHDVLIAVYPLTTGAKRLGAVAVGLWTAHARNEVRRMVIRVVAIATAGVLLALAVVLMLASAIIRRNRDLKLIMDNVAQGFLTVKRNGELLPEHSAILETWFGPWPAGQLFWSYFAGRAASLAISFELFWGNVVSDDLPIEFALDQLPVRVLVGQRTLEFSYTPIVHGTQIVQILFMVSDVTLVIERERASIEQQELVSLFQWMLKDERGLLEFFADGSRLVREIGRGPAAELVIFKRLVHTLKGNCAMYGLGSVASVCQTIEGELEEDAAVVAEARLAELAGAWRDVESRLQRLMSDGRESAVIALDASEHRAFLAAVSRKANHAALLEIASSWTLDPLKPRLERLGQQALGLARKLGKGDLDIRLDAGGIRLPDGALSEFWGNVVHAIRNAVDHGIEAPEVRAAAGKPARGCLSLRATMDAESLAILVEDDGAGVRWDKLTEKARALGLPTETHADLVEALFADGVSTRDEATDISGRGVGMSALRASCIESGGRIDVWSEPGAGSRFQFTWPVAALPPRPVSPAVLAPVASRTTSRSDDEPAIRRVGNS